MPDGSHPQDADGKGDRSCHRERLHDRAVKPVVELPVAEEICGLEQECRPESRSQPVYSVKGEFGHGSRVSCAADQEKQVDDHHSSHNIVHAAPVKVVHEPCRQYAGDLHAAEDDDMQEWKEYGEVSSDRRKTS